MIGKNRLKAAELAIRRRDSDLRKALDARLSRVPTARIYEVSGLTEEDYKNGLVEQDLRKEWGLEEATEAEFERALDEHSDNMPLGDFERFVEVMEGGK